MYIYQMIVLILKTYHIAAERFPYIIQQSHRIMLQSLC